MTVEDIKDLVQIAIQTNEREVVFTSFSGHILIKQSLDGETSSVVLTTEELGLLNQVTNGDNLSHYMSHIFNNKAL